ncbi:MAG: hypothetical protein ACI4JW_05270 [Oscillospiraceae bacterium]
MTGKYIKKTLAAIASAILIISACIPCFDGGILQEIPVSAQAYGQNDTVELPIIPIDPDEPDEPEDPENPDDPGNSTEPDEIPESVDLSKAKGLEITLEADSFEYSAKAVKPAVSVLLDGKELTKNKDFALSYSNNVSIGYAKATVTGIGQYCGSVSRSFKILPKMQTIKELKLSGSGFSCALTRDDKCTGYEIEYSLKPDFSLSKKKISNSVSAVKLTADLLEAGKTYYVRARSVKKVGSYSFYGKWSKTSKISSAPVYCIKNGSADFISAYSTRSGRNLKLKTGRYSAECKSGKYYVSANFTQFIVDKKYVSLVAGSGKLYPTSCVSQLGAKYSYKYGSGPACAVMLLNSEKGLGLSKSKVYQTAEKKGWCADKRGFKYADCDQIQLKKTLEYLSKQPVSVDSIKGRTSNAIQILIKRQLNNGRRCIVAVRKSSSGRKTANPVTSYNTKSDIIGYVVVAGYTKENGVEYFYVAEPWYQDNTGYVYCNYGLTKVKAETLAKSVKSIPDSKKNYKNIVHFN